MCTVRLVVLGGYMNGHWLVRSGCRLRGGLIAGLLAIVLGSWLTCTGPAAAAAPGRPLSAAQAPASTDWPAYLNGPLHSSYAPAQTAITPASTSRLADLWHHGPGRTYLASPTVADGAVFIGEDDGWFYKLSLTSGKVLARRFLGFQPHKTCGAFGTVDTATVTTDPGDHQPTVYVAGANGYLYALNAANLRVKWKSVIAIPSTKVSNYFDWSSPTAANGRIYIGLASNCDDPLVHAGLISYSQVTGRKLGEFYTTPKGHVGGSIWSSVAVAPDGDVFATTGNGPANDQLLGQSDSILKFSPKLRLLGKFQVPASQLTYDADFGASPVLFGRYVGACDKNGIFYAVRQSTMKLAWEKKVSGSSGPVTGCIAAAAYDGHHLFIGGLSVAIHGVSYRGSIQERDPGNGKLVWETGLPDGVIGSPSLDGGGVLSVGTYDISSVPCATYLVRVSDGRILRRLVTGKDFSQSVFADAMLFTASLNGVYAWHVKHEAGAA
jgi:outer membrane protein assembly factor BamB